MANITTEKAIYTLEQMKTWSKDLSDDEIDAISLALHTLSSGSSNRVCNNCYYWDSENNISGYCHACKHGYFTGSWDIGIYRKTNSAFYCADWKNKKRVMERD